MASRYIRPETDFQEEIPNGPFEEDLTKISESMNVQTSLGPVGLGDLKVVGGQLRVGPGEGDSGNYDYGVF